MTGATTERQQLIRIGADLAHQMQRLAVGADEEVLAVVEIDLLDRDTAGAAAERAASKTLTWMARSASATAAASPAQPAPMIATRCGEGAGEKRAGRVIARASSLHPARLAAFAGTVQALTQVFHASHSLRIGVSAMRCASTRQSSRRISARSVR